jgi:hypothetical protein
MKKPDRHIYYSAKLNETILVDVENSWYFSYNKGSNAGHEIGVPDVSVTSVSGERGPSDGFWLREQLARDGFEYIEQEEGSEKYNDEY